MRVLVLGAGGMLGHKVYQVLQRQFDVYGTFRGDVPNCPLYDIHKVFPQVEARELYPIRTLLEWKKPDVVINCIGITKQKIATTATAIAVNALFPHQLADLCESARLIHISTDCVFSGHKGDYTEEDTPDPIDLYGHTKLMGEIERDLTIRTSIIGRELKGQYGLLEWFLSQQKVKGYVGTIFSGLTTQALAQVLGDIIADYPTLSGLYHIASTPIDKYSLLSWLRREMDLNIDVEPYYDAGPNRSLCPKKFVEETGYKLPTWEEMITDLADDDTPYEEWRHA